MRARDVPWDASTTRSQPPGDMAGRNGNMGELKAPYGGLRVRPRRRGSAAEWRARAAGAALLLASLALLRRLHLDGLAPPRLLPPFRPRDLVRESISRTPATSLIESPSWQWGACGGAAAMYPESICGRSYCLRSVAYPGVSIDLFYHAFKQVRDPELLKMCQDPVGGQTGFGARAIEVGARPRCCAQRAALWPSCAERRRAAWAPARACLGCRRRVSRGRAGGRMHAAASARAALCRPACGSPAPPRSCQPAAGSEGAGLPRCACCTRRLFPPLA